MRDEGREKRVLEGRRESGQHHGCLSAPHITAYQGAFTWPVATETQNPYESTTIAVTASRVYSEGLAEGVDAVGVESLSRLAASTLSSQTHVVAYIGDVGWHQRCSKGA